MVVGYELHQTYGGVFDFLVNWNPIAMKERDARGRILLHRFAIDGPLDIFLTKLRIGLQQFPYGLGLLFEKSNSGETVLFTASIINTIRHFFGRIIGSQSRNA